MRADDCVREILVLQFTHMLWSSADISAVRQEQGHRALKEPLGLCACEERVDDRLRAVGKIAVCVRQTASRIDSHCCSEIDRRSGETHDVPTSKPTTANSLSGDEMNSARPSELRLLSGTVCSKVV